MRLYTEVYQHKVQPKKLLTMTNKKHVHQLFEGLLLPHIKHSAHWSSPLDAM